MTATSCRSVLPGSAPVDRPALDRVRADLAAEHAALDEVLALASPDRWRLTTASPGWTVADQVGHLAFFDRTAVLSIADPDGFAAHRVAHLAAVAGDRDPDDQVTLGAYRRLAGERLLATWRAGAADLNAAAASLNDSRRLPWYGPPMGARSFLTARLMETWAHGQDVVDTLLRAGVAVTREPTDRLRHVAHLGVLTRGWSYANRGLAVPTATVRVELTSPRGEVWTFGDVAAADVVRGSAEDFCLVVTQRRHVDDTDLATDGPLARDWMVKAQAFAGPATDGPVVAAARGRGVRRS